MEHSFFICLFFFTVHTCGGSKDVQYISLASLVRWSWLTLFSACFARIVFLGGSWTSFALWAWWNSSLWFDHVVQCSPVELKHVTTTMTPLVSGVSSFLFSAPLCQSSFHGPNLWWLRHSCLFFFFFVCLFPPELYKQLTDFLFKCCGFNFLCQRLFKGKVSDVDVWYHRFVFLCFFITETVQSRYSIVLPCFVKWQSGRNTVDVYSRVQKRQQGGKKKRPDGEVFFNMAGRYSAIVWCTASRTSLEGGGGEQGRWCEATVTKLLRAPYALAEVLNVCVHIVVCWHRSG